MQVFILYLTLTGSAKVKLHIKSGKALYDEEMRSDILSGVKESKHFYLISILIFHNLNWCIIIYRVYVINVIKIF